MLVKKISRRKFMVGCSTAIAAMAGSKLTMTAFAAPEDSESQEVLLVVFLRGGADGLNLVPPIAGDDRGYYEQERQNLAIPTSGSDAALPLNQIGSGAFPPNVQFGLHPSAAALHDLYQDGKLAIVHAAGLDLDNRSHFDMMDFMERGVPGDKTTGTGWLTRHLQTSPQLPGQIIMPALGIGYAPPASLLGSREAITLESFGVFNLNTGPWRWRDASRAALRHFYEADSSWLHAAGTQTLDAVDVVENQDTDNYQPSNGAQYPDGSFGRQLKTIAQTIKMQVGLRVATIDLGGWDTHEYQGSDGGGYFSYALVEPLAKGLAALYTDLDGAGDQNYTKRLTVVVMSEFGRKLVMNASRGTDHGHGNVMMVLGGEVNGGVYGDWPGLASEQLYQGRDLAITTDYRRVLSEILIRRLENPILGAVFPGYTGYEPLGVTQGTDLTPVYDPTAAHKVFLPLIIR